MASKKLEPFIKLAKKHVISVEYDTLPPTEERGIATRCRLVVGGFPVIRKADVRSEGIAYFNPTDPRGYSTTEGRRIAFERALKAAAKRVKLSIGYATDDLRDNLNGLDEGALNLLRAIVATQNANAMRYHMRNEAVRESYRLELNYATTALCGAGEQLLKEHDEMTRKLRKLAV